VDPRGDGDSGGWDTLGTGHGKGNILRIGWTSLSLYTGFDE